MEQPSARGLSVLSSAPGPKCNRTDAVFVEESAVQTTAVEKRVILVGGKKVLRMTTCSRKNYTHMLTVVHFRLVTCEISTQTLCPVTSSDAARSNVCIHQSRTSRMQQNRPEFIQNCNVVLSFTCVFFNARFIAVWYLHIGISVMTAESDKSRRCYCEKQVFFYVRNLRFVPIV